MEKINHPDYEYFFGSIKPEDRIIFGNRGLGKQEKAEMVIAELMRAGKSPEEIQIIIQDSNKERLDRTVGDAIRKIKETEAKQND